MIKKTDKADFIIRKLNEYYPVTPIPLEHKNDFTLLIAVLLSAQSTDKKVNELTPNLFKNGATAKDLYRFGEKNIYTCILTLKKTI